MTTEPGPRGTRRRRLPAEVGQDVLKKSLPASLRHAVQNYRRMAFTEAPEDAREFQQHQAACKAALQHIDALMKLATAVGVPTGGAAETGQEHAGLLARAEAAVDAYTNPKAETESEE